MRSKARRGFAFRGRNYDVEIEHLLAKLLEQNDTDLHKICNHYEVNIDRLSKDVQTALGSLKTGNTRTPAMSERIPRWLQDAWLLASVDFGVARIVPVIWFWLCFPMKLSHEWRGIFRGNLIIFRLNLCKKIAGNYRRFKRGTRCRRARRNGRRGESAEQIASGVPGNDKGTRSIHGRFDGESESGKN